MRITKSTKHRLPLSALLIAFVATFCFGSGSVGGGGGISQYGQKYKQGKAIFFQKVACARTECAIRKSDLDVSLARELVGSLRSKDELKAEESSSDKAVAVLVGKEVEYVEHYLSRRFNL